MCKTLFSRRLCVVCIHLCFISCFQCSVNHHDRGDKKGAETTRHVVREGRILLMKTKRGSINTQQFKIRLLVFNPLPS